MAEIKVKETKEVEVCRTLYFVQTPYMRKKKQTKIGICKFASADMLYKEYGNNSEIKVVSAFRDENINLARILYNIMNQRFMSSFKLINDNGNNCIYEGPVAYAQTLFSNILREELEVKKIQG
jgi:hypothetical protein